MDGAAFAGYDGSMTLPLALASLALTMGAWLHYLALIPKERVPARPTAHRATLVAALLLGAYAALGGGADAASIIIAAASASLALFFFYLLGQAPLPDGKLVVAVGDPLPVIEAMSSDGERSRSTDWAGQRVLFKFFRGHW